MRGRQTVEGVPGAASSAGDPQPSSAARGPRFDPAHSTSGHALDEPVTPPGDVLLAIAGRNGELAGEQLRQQAAELSEHLRRRHRELARWEATLNARSAQYDDQQRAARLWLREQQNELESREADCQRQQRLLAARAAELESADRTSSAATHQWEQQHAESLAERRQQLQLELDHVRQQAASLEAAYRDWQQQRQQEQQALQQLRQRLEDQGRVAEQLHVQLRERIADHQRSAEDRDQLDRRQRALDLREAELCEAEAAWEQQRQRLLDDHQFREQRSARQRAALAAHWRGRLRALRQHRQMLEQRQATLNRQRESLDQLQRELDARQQEIAQQCLALEHAQAVVERRAAPHDFTHLVQLVRQYTQNQLTAAEQTLVTQRQELQALAAALLRQEQSLKMRHARMQAQNAARQSELDAQAALLAEREHAIAQREYELQGNCGTPRTPPP